MGECLDKLQNATFFSTVDLAQGYHQVPLRKEDREKTAFRSPNGLWQWLVMPEGLKSAPATLSRLMQRVFNHIPSERIVLYFDDVCCIFQTIVVNSSNSPAFHFFDMDIPRKDQEVQDENKLIDAQAVQETGVRRSKRARGPPERFGELTW